MIEWDDLNKLLESTGVINMGTEWIMLGICLLLLWLRLIMT